MKKLFLILTAIVVITLPILFYIMYSRNKLTLELWWLPCMIEVAYCGLFIAFWVNEHDNKDHIIE